MPLRRGPIDQLSGRLGDVETKLDLSTKTDLNQAINAINKNLAEVINASEGAAAKGLLKAVTFIQGEAQEITPQRHGILVGSAFSGVARIGAKIVGRVGYTARYAAAVHEMPDPTVPRSRFRRTKKGPSFTVSSGGKPVNWTKPDTGNKFLEKAVKQNLDMILKFMREFMTL